MNLIQKQTEIRINPKKMLLFSHPKAGKTTAISGLKNALIIDLEDGSSFIKADAIVNVLVIVGKRLNLEPKEVLNDPKGLEECLNVLRELVEELKSSNFDYIVIDTVTALVKIATYLASSMYKASPMGKNYTGHDVVKDLANGAGYEWLRQAYERILSSIEPHAKECAIEIGHVKDASIMKIGGDVSARDLQLPGKIKYILCQNADAVGYLYRKDGVNTIVSFKNDERDLATGARPEHLNNQEFVLVQEEPKGSRQFIYNWDKVFLAKK